MANKNFKVKNSITIPEPLALTEGGTGQTSATNALNALLPVQSSAASKFLQSDGTNVSWVANVAYQRGGTGSRPGSPTVGDIYYNTDYNYFEQYTSAGWFVLAAAPGIPTGVTATNQGSGRAYNNGQSSVAFTASSSGGVASSFTVTPTPSTSPSTFTGSSSPVTVTGLASSTQYTYTVAATSPYGTSSASSASSGVTATTVPQAPTINSVTGAAQSAIITFTAGATGGSAITSYSITSSPATTTQTASSSPYTFTGLTDGTSYTFTMTATNTNGTSLASSASSEVVPQSIIEDMVPLGVITVGSGGSSTITFSSIPSTYTHLELRISAKNTSTSASPWQANILMQFNGVATGTPYDTHYLGGGGASTFSGALINYNEIYCGKLGNNNNSYTNILGTSIISILDYKNTSKNKTVRVLTGLDVNGAGEAMMLSGQWRSTNAISSITLTSGDSFETPSIFALYGIKG